MELFEESNMYKNNPQTNQDLKTNITNNIEKISRSTLENVFDNIVERYKLYVEQNGGHFKHLLKHRQKQRKNTTNQIFLEKRL
jgi:hypothetical protein